MSNRKSLFHLRSLPPTVAALAVVGLSGSALAQVGNPTTGATLYKTPVAIPNGVQHPRGDGSRRYRCKDERRDRSARQREEHESVRCLDAANAR